MPIHFVCPVCKTTYAAQDRHAGKKAECKNCGQRVQVPFAMRNKTVLGEALTEPPPTPKPVLPPPLKRDVPLKAVESQQDRTSYPSLSFPARRDTNGKKMGIYLIFGFVAAGLLASGVLILILSVKRVEELETPVAKGKEKRPGAGGSKKQDWLEARKPIEANPTRVENEETPLPSENPLNGEQVYLRLVRSSVLVATPTGFGSGFVVDKEKRLVVTNYHVAPKGEDVRIVFPMYNKSGQPITELSAYDRPRKQVAIAGTVIDRSVSRDLALIRVESLPANSGSAPLSTKPAATGSTVFSVGGSGAEDGLLWRLTKGSVRGRGQRRQQSDFGVFDCIVLETDAPVNPGDSGGPVMNDRGEIVGVVSHFSTQRRQVSGNIDVQEVRGFLGRHLRVR